MKLPELPEGYKEKFTIDLKNDKKTYAGVNIATFIIAAAMMIPALIKFPIAIIADFSSLPAFIMYLLKLLLILLLILLLLAAYIVLHELTHAAAMKLCGAKKVNFGFSGLFAYAGSNAFFSKGEYIFIALLPLVFWGIVLLTLNLVLPQSLFWPIYLIQVQNVSGATGDVYVSARMLGCKKDDLITDNGLAMRVFSRVGE